MVELLLKMLVETKDYKFELEDSWIDEAGFNPSNILTQHYVTNRGDSKDIMVISISDTYPKIRNEGVPVFNNGEVDGVLQTAKQRTTSILKAFMDNTELPPVGVVDFKDNEYKYKLVHGSHRLHCSIAAGFKKNCSNIWFRL